MFRRCFGGYTGRLFTKNWKHQGANIPFLSLPGAVAMQSIYIAPLQSSKEKSTKCVAIFGKSFLKHFDKILLTESRQVVEGDVEKTVCKLSVYIISYSLSKSARVLA